MEFTITINLNDIFMWIVFIYVSSYLLIEILELATFEELYMGEYISYIGDIFSCFRRGLFIYTFKMILRLPIETYERYLIWMKHNV